MPSMGLGQGLPRPAVLGGFDFSALPNLPAGRQSSDGWIDQATIDSFADAAIWLDAYNTFSDTGATVAALTGDAIAAIKDNAAARTWTQANASNRMTLAATPTRLTGDYTKTVAATGNTVATGANIVIATNAGILNAVGNIPASLTVRNLPGMIHWVSGALSSGDIDRVKAFAVAEGATDNDFAGMTNFSNYFRAFNFLTSFPLINTSSGTTFFAAWFDCTGLTSFPLINTAAALNFNSAWQNCTGLTSFPLINTAIATNFAQAWQSCSGLTSFPLLVTSSGTGFNNAWQGCTNLTSFPAINTAAGVNFQTAWFQCTSLTAFPLLNTTSGTNFQTAWSGCTSLATFPANFFDGCSATNFTNAFASTNLSETSIDGILVSINSNGTSGGTFNQSGGTAPSVATGRPAIDAMRGRGWTVTVTGGY